MISPPPHPAPLLSSPLSLLSLLSSLSLSPSLPCLPCLVREGKGGERSRVPHRKGGRHGEEAQEAMQLRQHLLPAAVCPQVQAGQRPQSSRRKSDAGVNYICLQASPASEGEGGEGGGGRGGGLDESLSRG